MRSPGIDKHGHHDNIKPWCWHDHRDSWHDHGKLSIFCLIIRWKEKFLSIVFEPVDPPLYGSLDWRGIISLNCQVALYFKKKYSREAEFSAVITRLRMLIELWFWFNRYSTTLYFFLVISSFWRKIPFFILLGGFWWVCSTYSALMNNWVPLGDWITKSAWKLVPELRYNNEHGDHFMILLYCIMAMPWCCHDHIMS